MDVPCFKTACARDEAYASINELKQHQVKTLGKLGLLDEAYKDRVVPDAKYLSKRSKAGSRAQKASAKAGAGGTPMSTRKFKWTFSSRVKQFSDSAAPS
jgi:hypothetical protein